MRSAGISWLIPLLFLHGPEGREIEVNAYDVAALAPPRETHFGKGTNCVLTMNSGKFVAVHESCQEVVKMITQLGKLRRERQ